MLFDPKGVQDFVMFDVVTPTNRGEESIIEFLKIRHKKPKKNVLTKQERVDILRVRYEELGPQEISPFGDK